MDQNPGVIDEKKKNDIYELLADYYVAAVEHEKINREERQQISKRIYDNMGKATTLSEIVAFIDALSQDYTFFLPALLKLKRKSDIMKERDIINKLAKYQ